jgi:hypothetical protein
MSKRALMCLEKILTPTNDRRELLRRLEQTRRIALQISDPQTVENLNKLAAEIEEELRRAQVGGSSSPI